LSFDVTGFYRDTRDWVTSSPEIYVGEREEGSAYSYTTYINKDYANSRGITLSVNKRQSGLLMFSFSYTYQTAEGINSNPDDARAAQKNNNEPAQTLAPLEWDQTHTANLTLGLSEENNWGAFILGRYGSGLPYTPVINQAEGQGQDANRAVRANSRRKPPNYTIDLRLFKNLRIDPITFSVFIKVYNLFDRRNEIDVFGETGRATATPQQVEAGNVTGGNRVNTVAEYLIRPDFYSDQREIQFGIEINY
jgi:outer membrane receptor for ferrienterochelin and colicin